MEHLHITDYGYEALPINTLEMSSRNKMSKEKQNLENTQNGNDFIADVSGSFFIGDDSKNVEFLNYYDGTIEISINEYGNEQTKMLSVEETQNLINWLINNCR